MTFKDPKGKFIGRSQMLEGWIPKFLDWAWQCELRRLLEAGIHWCQIQAAREAERGAGALVESADEGYFAVCAHSAELWLKRAAVLRKAIIEVLEIR